MNCKIEKLCEADALAGDAYLFGLRLKAPQLSEVEVSQSAH